MAIGLGDHLRDNDPRTKERTLYVRKIQGGYAHCATEVMGQVRTRVRLDRIHTDGKPRRTGYSLIPAKRVEPPGSEGGCSRCGGTGVDPEVSGCRCDCCGRASRTHPSSTQGVARGG